MTFTLTHSGDGEMYGEGSRDYIFADGTFCPNTPDAFTQFLKQHPPADPHAVVVLNSPGGDLDAGPMQRPGRGQRFGRSAEDGSAPHVERIETLQQRLRRRDAQRLGERGDLVALLLDGGAELGWAAYVHDRTKGGEPRSNRGIGRDCPEIRGDALA